MEQTKLKIRTSTWVRTGLLILALFNTALQLMGMDVLPIGEAELETGITVVLNTSAALVAWWHNNSFSQKWLKIESEQEKK